MPSSNLPPEEQREVKPFDPLVLDRTVIAVPLLEQMQEDLELIAEFEKRRPKVAQEFNSVIEFNKNFRGGAKAAREEVLKMVSPLRTRRSKPQQSELRRLRMNLKPR